MGGGEEGEGGGTIEEGVGVNTTSMGRAFQSTMVFGDQEHLPVLCAVAVYFATLGMGIPCRSAVVRRCW